MAAVGARKCATEQTVRLRGRPASGSGAPLRISRCQEPLGVIGGRLGEKHQRRYVPVSISDHRESLAKPATAAAELVEIDPVRNESAGIRAKIPAERVCAGI